MTLSMIETARRENVILFNLPPHTTHVTQPLDESIFKPLKAAFGNGDQSFSPSTSTAVVRDSTPTSGEVTPTSTSSGGAMLTSNGASRTCSPNPLLDAGLIAANLADMLQVPQKKERMVRRRFVSTARVITAHEYVEGMRQRDEEARLKEEEKRRKKEEREQKREKAEEKERKQAEKERKKAEKEQKQAQKGKTERET